ARGTPHLFFRFDLVYWADILHPQPLNPKIKNRSHPLFLFESYAKGGEFRCGPRALQRTLRDQLKKQIDRVFLKKDMTLNFAGVTDVVLHRYFRDLQAYYSGKQTIRDRIRRCAADVIRRHQGKRILLVAHSMGSIVAYDVLTRTASDLSVDVLATIGSPLGLPVVIGKIHEERKSDLAKKEALRVPPGVRTAWINFSDFDDRVALDYKLADEYGKNARGVGVEDHLVCNNYECNGKRNPHKSYGYLRAPEMAEMIDAFLNRGKPKLWIWLTRALAWGIKAIQSITTLSALLLFSILLNPVNAQDFIIRWNRGADFPLRLSEIKAISCNNKVYVIGGKITKDNADPGDNEDVDFTFEYDPKNQTWTRKANMPSRRYDVALAVVEDRIYAISTRNEVFNPVSDTWEVLSPLPGGMPHLEAAVVNDKIYVIGCEEGAFNKTMMYDPKTDVWIEKAPIPTSRLSPSVAVVDDKIVVMGGIGFDENNRLGKFLRDVEVFDPVNDTWETKKPMPHSMWGAEGAIVLYGQIFLINVRLSETHNGQNTYTYNPMTENWSAATNLPKCYSEQGITLLNRRMYVIGGHDGDFIQYNDVFVGDIQRPGQY
ncbi:MAG TPA: hypothetical protein VGB38_04840, partial [bacterium]